MWSSTVAMRLGFRGFSFLELMVTVALLSILAILGIRSFGSERARAGSEGLAQVVLAELEAAQGRARSSRLPVAFCLPSQDGTSCNAQSFYLMEGEVAPRATTTRSFGGDFPSSVMAPVYWGSSATLTRPPGTGSAPANAVAQWLGSRIGRDYALVFMPDGSVMSNDLPVMDNEYRLVVAGGLKASPGSPDGAPQMPASARPQNFLLESAFAAQTICISLQGEMRIESGIAQPEGVEILTGGLALAAGPADLVLPANPTATTPSVARVLVHPKPYLEPKATVQQEKNLSLTVEAEDADGQSLFCSWKAEPVGGAAGEGLFSLGDEHPMLWDKTLRRWVSRCTWAPPTTANVGDQYTLTCEVMDSDGNTVQNTANILNPVTVVPPGRILFHTKKRGNTDVAIINGDGTGLRYLTDGAGEDLNPCVSPDASKIAWVDKGFTAKGEVFVMNIDGTGKTRVTTNNANESTACWSPDGLKIIYMRNWPDYLHMSNANGTGEVMLGTTQGSSSYSAVMSPDGRYIINVANMSGPGEPSVSGELIVSEFVMGPNPQIVEPTNVTNNSSSRTMDGLPTFLPGTTNYELVWASASPGPSGNFLDAYCNLTLARLRDNGAGTTPRFELVDRRVFRTDGPDNLVFSPDASKVVFTRRFPTYGIFIANWTIAPDGTPSMTGERRLTGFTGSEIPKAWIR
jgi:TolB protein